MDLVRMKGINEQLLAKWENKLKGLQIKSIESVLMVS